MELSGAIANLQTDFKSCNMILSLAVNEKANVMQLFEDFKDTEKLQIKITKYREKRSLDANAYFWTLVDKLAVKLNKTKTEVYRDAIRDIGGNSETVCVKNNAVKKLCSVWQNNGLGFQTETFTSKIEGCTNIILYFGSSTFDTSQMSRLISNIVQDCEAVGIETKTPDQIAEMMSLWESENG